MKPSFYNSLLLIAIFLTSACSPTEDTRTREWLLADQTHIIFSHEKPSFLHSDHAKFIDVIALDGKRQHYSFGESHSGYNEVDLFINPNQTEFWIIDRKAGSGAHLDLKSETFSGELSRAIPQSDFRVLSPRK